VPITPFHFGPGVLFHAASPRRVSFIAFVAANCITDIESIYNVLNGNFPVHRFLHTFAGAAVSAAMTIALFLFMGWPGAGRCQTCSGGSNWRCRP